MTTPAALPSAQDPARRVRAEWTQRVNGLVHLPGLLRTFGVDPAAVLAAAGLNAGELGSSENYIPYTAGVAILNLAVGATGCPHVGVLSGEAWRLEDFGLIGEIMRHSATAGDALEAFAVNQRLHSKGAAVYVARRGAAAELGYAVHHPVVDQAAPVFDSAMATGMSIMRELCGADWRPSEVFLPRAAPADAAPWRRVFKAPVRFDASECCLRFPAGVLDRPVATADPQRRDAAELALARLADHDLVPLVYRAARVLLLEGTVTVDRLAEHMAMHRRTLERRLQRQHSSVQAIFDDVRHEVARQLLRETNQSVTAVAHAVGFADSTAFIRAFRNWAGTSPGQWRKRHRAEGRSPRLP